MARKGQVSIQDSVETDEEYEAYMEANKEKLICMEVYSDFAGPCNAMNNAVRKAKLEIGGDGIAMVKARADNIEALSRFKNRSEPLYLFYSKGLLTRILFGANGIKLCDIVTEELHLEKMEAEGAHVERVKMPVDEMLPEEQERYENEDALEKKVLEEKNKKSVIIQAMRKRRANERLAEGIKKYNFVLYWPHCHQAHLDLYEKYDAHGLYVMAKEEKILTEDEVKELLYMSDIDPNEACVHALLTQHCMAVMFKMMDSDERDFIELLRYTLYEELPALKPDLLPAEQPDQITAYMKYSRISEPVKVVRRNRYNQMLLEKEKEREEQERIAAEKERLAREAEEERLREEKEREEQEKMARLQAGATAAPPPEEVEEAPPAEEAPPEETKPEGEENKPEGEEGAEPKEEQPEGEQVEAPPAEGEGEVKEEEPVEEVPEEEAPFDSSDEIEGEDYIPPGGLFVPGLYTPANILAKANGMKLFFHKEVSKITNIESETLPPHILMLFAIDKRHDVVAMIKQFPEEIIHMGIFLVPDLQSAQHMAYTVKQFDKMFLRPSYKEKLALMVSAAKNTAMLNLTQLNPEHVSFDEQMGELECRELFPVGYGDDYEEEESIEPEAEDAVEGEAAAEPKPQEPAPAPPAAPQEPAPAPQPEEPPPPSPPQEPTPAPNAAEPAPEPPAVEA